MIAEKLLNSDLMFRDYKPYSDGEVNLVRPNLFNYAESERANMERLVGEILDGYMLRDYVSSKGGFDRIISNINTVIDLSGFDFSNKRILEFGAGICKLSAAISAKFDVSEIWCLDHAEGLLREIAPRVINIVGADLKKFKFVIGDMNSAYALDEKFDAIVCYGAVHHLHLPEYFFESIPKILNPGGIVLIVDEPTLPAINNIPGTPVVRWKKRHYAIRRIGDNENAYTINGYLNLFGRSWNAQLIHSTKFSRLFLYQPFFAFMSNFILKPAK